MNNQNVNNSTQAEPVNAPINEGYQPDSEEIKTIDILGMIFFILSKWYVLVAVALITALIGYTVTVMSVTPLYQSQAKIYLLANNVATIKTESGIVQNDITSVTRLITNSEILIKEVVIQKAINNLGLNMTASALSKNVTITNPTDSHYLYISVKSPDSATSKLIVDEICRIASEEIVNTIGIERVSIITEGNIPTSPCNNNTVRNTGIGAFAGLFIVALIYGLIYFFDDKIKTSEDIEKYLSVPVLGVIPQRDKY